MAFPPHHSFMFHTHDDYHHHDPHSPTSLKPFPPLPPPQHFQPPTRGGGGFMMKRSMSFSGMERASEEEEEAVSDDGSVGMMMMMGEKKKRLNVEQVKALEKSFEVGNKLEPERKMELAKALGLQPRQIAIWFQNRRARWKTKNLEKEYEILKKQFDSLKADNDALKLHNQKLHAELQAIKGRDSCEGGTVLHHMKKENEGSWSNNGSDNSSDMNLDLSRTPTIMNSPVCSQNNGKSQLVPSSTTTSLLNNNKPTPPTISQLLHFSSRSDLQDETFVSNMFNSANNIDHHHHDDQHQNFWTWPHDHNNHFH